jgi:hypothetical protein
MNWIKVEDKLPEEGQEVIMTYNDLVLTGEFLEGKFFYFWSSKYGMAQEEQEGITHWMPLPNPPED